VFLLAVQVLIWIAAAGIRAPGSEPEVSGWSDALVRASGMRRPALITLLRAIQLIAASLFVLGLIVRLDVVVWRRPLAWVASAIVWWLGVELLVAPHLSIGNWNMHYRMIHELDHRPKDVGGRFNEDSVIARESSSAFAAEDLNLLFLGDSFTMGFLLPAGDEAFPALVGAEIARRHPAERVHVANFGWVSSSPFLSHRRLVDIGAKYAPDLVVLSVDMTDFADDLRYQRVLDQRGIYWLYDKIPLTLRIASAIAPVTYRRFAAWSVGGMPDKRFFATESPLDETREWMLSLVENCDRIAAWCSEHGARFALVILPRSYQYSATESPRNNEADQYEILGPHSLEPFRFFDEVRPTKPYPIYSLLEDFRANTEFPTCFEDDPHWNATGHRVAARAITRHLEPVVEDLVSGKR